MPTSAPLPGRMSLAPRANTASVLSSLLVYDCDRDGPGVLIPRPEIHVVVRFGPSARNGLDVHAFGSRQNVHRKLIRSGQRTVTARLQMGASEAVLGLSASEIAGRIVALEDLWGGTVTQRLCSRLKNARNTTALATILESAIAERMAGRDRRRVPAPFVLAAIEKLTRSSVNMVARDLGLSERHLRRVFHETVGVSPKAFAKLARFRQALRVAREETHVNWANIAVATGYYDQAHLIAGSARSRARRRALCSASSVLFRRLGRLTAFTHPFVHGSFRFCPQQALRCA